MKKIEISKEAKYINFTVSCCMCAAGVVLLVIPGISKVFSILLLSILLLICGLAKLLGYFSNDLYRLAFQFDYAFGIFDVILGTALIISGKAVFPNLPIIIGICVMLDGLLKQQIAIDARRFGISHWQIILLSGILLTAVGAMAASSSGIVDSFTSNIFLPIALIADGIENAWITMYTVKVRTKK